MLSDSTTIPLVLWRLLTVLASWLIHVAGLDWNHEAHEEHKGQEKLFFVLFLLFVLFVLFVLFGG